MFVVLSTCLLLIVAAAYALLMRSPYGRLLNAIRLDEIAVVAAAQRAVAKLGVVGGVRRLRGRRRRRSTPST